MDPTGREVAQVFVHGVEVPWAMVEVPWAMVELYMRTFYPDLMPSGSWNLFMGQTLHEARVDYSMRYKIASDAHWKAAASAIAARKLTGALGSFQLQLDLSFMTQPGGVDSGGLPLTYTSDSSGGWGGNLFGAMLRLAAGAAVGLITSAEVGFGALFFGAGAQGGAGVGILLDKKLTLSGLALADAGAFAGGPRYGVGLPSPNNVNAFNVVSGAYAGGGLGLFFSTATSAADLRGPAHVISWNLGLGPLGGLSLQLTLGASAVTGVVAISPPGGSWGASISSYRTYGWAEQYPSPP